MNIEIDNHSGFCFGVVYGIKTAENELEKQGNLFCLGDIVHNNAEVERLKSKGLIIINYQQFKKIKNTMVLIRAHGEPPETYKIAFQNNIQLIDASCPVVLKFQNKIKKGYDQIIEKDGQVVIYGKNGHAEVNGLVGQTKGKAIVVNKHKDLNKIDFSKPVNLFSQTTQSKNGFNKIKEEIIKRMKTEPGNNNINFISNDTICPQVSHREPRLRKFARQHDIIIFVSGKKSSNGKMLFSVCKKINPKTYFVSNVDDIERSWLKNIRSVGICGATSTPWWLMEKIVKEIKSIK